MTPETGGDLPSIIFGGAGLGGIIWALYERIKRQKLESANIDSGVAVANANEALFTMLTTRLTTLEEEVKLLRSNLDKEREYTRILVSVMVEAGLKPPAYPVTG